MGFLVKQDYKTLIREDVLDVVIESDESLLSVAELSATEEMVSYLGGRYDTALIFIDVKLYAIGVAYVTGDFVYLIADAWAAQVYQVNDLVSWTDGNVYKCTQLTTGTEDPDNASYFELWGVNKGFYTSLVDEAGAKPADPAKFTFGDTRSQLIVRYLIDLTVYELHSRINPRNIPDLRVDRRNDALEWLSKVADPRNDISPDLPEKDFGDNRGPDISWGQLDTTRNRY